MEINVSVQSQSQIAIAVSFFCHTNFSVYPPTEQRPDASRRQPDNQRIPSIDNRRTCHGPAIGACPRRCPVKHANRLRVKRRSSDRNHWLGIGKMVTPQSQPTREAIVGTFHSTEGWAGRWRGQENSCFILLGHSFRRKPSAPAITSKG